MSHRPKLLSLALAALALLALAPVASAFTTRAPLGSFGPDGTSATRFGAPTQLAFDQARDRLYLDDTGPDSIYCFSAPAHTPCGGPFPMVVAAAGNSGGGLAVDSTAGASAGNLFYIDRNVTSLSSTKLFGFNSVGTPLGGNFPIPIPSARGTAVDSVGNIWVAADTGPQAKILKFDLAGNPLGVVLSARDLAGSDPEGLALDPANNLYVSYGSSGVRKYTAASGYRTSTQLAGTAAAGDSIKGLAVDRTTDRVYVEGNNDVKVFDSSGTQLYQFGQIPGGSLGHKGITIDESTDRVYVSDDLVGGSGSSDRVWVFGPPADYPNATITQNPAANVTEITADLSGTLDDNSVLATNWSFQVSKDGGTTWTTPGTSSGKTQGSQSGVALSVRATGLLQDTDYRARIATNKGPGSTSVFSNEVTFRTVAIPPATATIDPAANVTADRADLRATVTDNGPFPTNWRFQVSNDGGANWYRATGTGVSGTTAGGQSGVVVSGTAAGYEIPQFDRDGKPIAPKLALLLPDTEYRLRIVISKGHGAPEVPVETNPFRTLAVPPVLSKVGSFRVLDTSAYLVGTINPRNAETRYFFEYGDEGPCDANACIRTAEAIVDGNDDVVVHPQVTDLRPDTTYDFRLTATNAAGPVKSSNLTFHTLAALPAQPNCDNEAIREAQGSTFLPECRAWEQVTPPNKNFGASGYGGSVAVDGQAVSFASAAFFGDPPATIGGEATSYLSRRGPGGWLTRALTPSYCHSGYTALAVIDGTPSANLDYAFINRPEIANCPLAKLVPGAPDSPNAPGFPPIPNFYRAHHSADPITYNLLVPEPFGGFEGASDDASHVVYSSSNTQQVPGAPAGDFRKIFEWHNGSLSLISRDTANIPFTTRSELPPEGGHAEYTNPVSARGDRIFFQNPATGTAGSCVEIAACNLYMRENATITHNVSESECAASCGASAGVQFRRATPDGSRVLFTSVERLTNAPTPAGSKLYLYTHSADPVNDENLTLLSRDGEASDGTNGGILGTLGISDGGDVVYFAAEGQLVSGAPTAAGPKLYRWRHNGGSPTLDYLATLISASGNDDLTNWTTSASRFRHATPDGRYLAIQTPAALDPIGDQDTDTDVYRWDEADGWACVSCQLPGVPSAGRSLLNDNIGHSSEMLIQLSDDARTVFFSSYDSLVPEDTNNGAIDIYQWHDGTIYLISSGKGTSDAQLIGADSLGANVYFHTEARLTGSDIDDVKDIYVARIGGGLASQNQPPPAPPCEGEACRGAGSSAPGTTGAGTPQFEGPGNPALRWPTRKLSCPRGKRKVVRNGRARCIKRQSKRGAKKRKTVANGRASR